MSVSPMTQATAKSEVTFSDMWQIPPRNWADDGKKVQQQRRCNRGRRWEAPRRARPGKSVSEAGEEPSAGFTARTQ